MKKILFILILILATVSFAFAESVDKNTVVIKYNRPINGLEIEILWKPQDLRNGDAFGPAIIQLTNPEYGTSSTVVCSNFSILQSRIDKIIKWQKDKEGYWLIKSISNNVINLDYTNPKIFEEDRSFGTTEEPFFFYDINFDGKKDFLVSEIYTGQRHYARFKAYELSDSQNIWVIEDNLYQITNKEPYILLDEISTVDRKNKVITINYSAGALDSYSVDYDILKMKEKR